MISSSIKFAAKNLIDTGDKVKSFFINPRKDEIMGVKTYQSLDQLPEMPDLILIGIPAPAVNPVLIQAGELGIKAAIVFSSGFAEDHRSGGTELEEEMIQIAKKYDMKIIGPNCLGIMNNVDQIKLWSTGQSIDFETREIGVAVLAQSGGYTIGAVDRQYIDLSYAISSGNGNIVTIEELMEYCVEDDNVKIIALYLEGIKKADVFCRALAKAAKAGKPVIILKSGSSEKGAISAASHTGNIAGSHQVFQAIFEKYGLKNIFLITPQTSDERIHFIDSVSDGFIYMVSSASVTGSSAGFGNTQEAYFQRIAQMNLKNPQVIGFGINNSETFQQATQFAKGAIIGSAFITYLKENGTANIKAFVESIR